MQRLLCLVFAFKCSECSLRKALSMKLMPESLAPSLKTSGLKYFFNGAHASTRAHDSVSSRPQNLHSKLADVGKLRSGRRSAGAKERPYEQL